MKTYLLETKDKKRFESLKGRAKFFLSKRRRAVVVLEKPPPKDMIVQELDGDQSTYVATWAERNILDDLNSEYLAQAPIPPHKQSKALERYGDALTRTANAEAALQRAKDLERAACKNLVRTFGRGPIVINGKTFDPCYTGETVFLIERHLAKAVE